MNSDPATTPLHAPERISGAFMGAGAYAIWGLLPIYLKSVDHVPALQILAHRIIWSLLLLTAATWLLQRGPQIAAAFRNRKVLLSLIASASLLAGNWLIYIAAVNSDHVLEASLGYFINPLLSVALATFLLKERLRHFQWLAISLAAGGVMLLVIAGGSAIWNSLLLAASFCLYGLIRKAVPVDSLVSLSVETIVLAPFALIYLSWGQAEGQVGFGSQMRTDLLLAGSGVITTVPLLLFAGALRSLTYSSVGLLQYIAPTLQFLLATIAYGEPVGAVQVITFICIWTGIAFYVADGLRLRASARKQISPHPALGTAAE